MVIQGYTLQGEWKGSTGGGMMVLASKEGKTYFLKRNHEILAPVDPGIFDQKTFEKKRSEFEKMVASRKKLNGVLRKECAKNRNVRIPIEEFVKEPYYIEVTEYIGKVLTRDEILDLSEEDKKTVLKTAVEALECVHRAGIVHSDLKPENILVVRHRNGKCESNIIDFDCSYFEKQKPDEIKGTIEYFSPEQANLRSFDGDNTIEKRKLEARVTRKSDIFSLGLAFHVFLTNELPETANLPNTLQKRKNAGRKVFCASALNRNGKLKISPRIGKSPYGSLIQDMLNKNPDERPSAKEILDFLNGASGKTTSKTSTTTTIEIAVPWPNHSILFDRETIRRRGWTSVRRAMVGDVKGYEFLSESHPEQNQFMTLTNVLLSNMAKKKSSSATWIDA